MRVQVSVIPTWPLKTGLVTIHLLNHASEAANWYWVPRGRRPPNPRLVESCFDSSVSTPSDLACSGSSGLLLFCYEFWRRHTGSYAAPCSCMTPQAPIGRL